MVVSYSDSTSSLAATSSLPSPGRAGLLWQLFCRIASVFTFAETEFLGSGCCHWYATDRPRAGSSVYGLVMEK